MLVVFVINIVLLLLLFLVVFYRIVVMFLLKVRRIFWLFLYDVNFGYCCNRCFLRWVLWICCEILIFICFGFNVYILDNLDSLNIGLLLELFWNFLRNDISFVRVMFW